MTDPIIFHTGKLPLEYLQSLLARYTRSDPRLVAGPGVGEDVAVIDMGERYMVVKTDPITFATADIGWYAVNVNANDIATSGAKPLWMLATLLLPENDTTPDLVEGIFSQLNNACSELGILLVGGHTEVTWGLERPIVVGVMIGEVARDKLLTTSGAREGDAILLVKGIPIEATAIIAREKAEDLIQRGFSLQFITRAQGFLHTPGISVVAAARVAAEYPGVHAMHDPTEGGLATGLHEVAYAAHAGILVQEAAIPLYPEGAELCRAYNLDPLGAIASGGLIVAVDQAAAAGLLARYQAAGIPCAQIGKLVASSEGLWMERVHRGRAPLPRYDADEITRIF
ncbi:MAG: AIR synthase family protein [Anaerolineae bacterium]